MKVVTIIFIKSTRVWPQVKSREGTQHDPSTENCIKDLLPDIQPCCGKDTGNRDQSVNIFWIIEKSKRVPEKHLSLFY